LKRERLDFVGDAKEGLRGGFFRGLDNCSCSSGGVVLRRFRAGSSIAVLGWFRCILSRYRLLGWRYLQGSTAFHRYVCGGRENTRSVLRQDRGWVDALVLWCREHQPDGNFNRPGSGGK
jgi:hypothetical protein